MLSALALVASTDAFAAARFLLAVGNNLGAADEVALRWAEDDAQRIHDALVALGSVAPDRALVLKGPTDANVREALARLRGRVEEANRRGERTELVVFYSGHGDAEALHLGESRLALSELTRLVRDIRAASTVTIVDASRSGRLARARGKGARRGEGFDVTLTREQGPTGHVLITSAGADEIAQESDELNASFFSHHLLSGLRGAADADRDQRVSLAELYTYAYHRTLADSHGGTAAVQHAEMKTVLAGEGELILSELSRASASLELPSPLWGDLLVVDDRTGRVVAELHKAPGTSAMLALPPGRFRLQLRQSARAFVTEVALEWGGRHTVRSEAMSEQRLASVLEKGRQLDASQWLLSAGAIVATPLVLDAPVATGGQVSMERQLFDLPLYVRGVAMLTYAQQGAKYNLETRVGMGAGAFIWWGPVRLSADVALGGLMINSRRATMGGLWVGPQLAVRVPVAMGFGINLTAGVQSAWPVVGASQANRLIWHGGVGADWEI